MSLSCIILNVETTQGSEIDPVPSVNPFALKLSEAQRYLKQEKWSEASALLKSIYRENQPNLAVDLALSRALFFSQGQRQEALKILQNGKRKTKGGIAEKYQDRLEVLAKTFMSRATFQVYQDGINLIMLGKVKSAQKVFEKALELEASNLEIVLRLIQTHLLLNEIESVPALIVKAQELNETDPELYMWSGRYAFLMGKFKEAMVLYKKAYDVFPESEQIAIWISELYWITGETKKSIDLLEKQTDKYTSNLMSMVAIAKNMATRGVVTDSRQFWEARKILQIVISRLESEGTSFEAKPKVLFDRILYQSVSLRQDVEKLLVDIDTRIQELNRSRVQKQ